MKNQIEWSAYHWKFCSVARFRYEEKSEWEVDPNAEARESAVLGGIENLVFAETKSDFR